MGATSGLLVTDPALEGSCTVSTTRVLAAALASIEFDLVLAGVDTSDGVVGRGRGRRRRAGRAAATCRMPPGSSPTRRPARSASGGSRPTGYDVLEAPMPALITCTQALGEPRYPSLKGIMAARSKEITTASLGGPRRRRRDGRAARSPRRASLGTQAPEAAGRHAGRSASRPTRPPARSSSSSPNGGSSDGRRSGSTASSPATGRSPGSAPRSRRSPARSATRRASRSPGSWSAPRPRPRRRSSRATCPGSSP